MGFILCVCFCNKSNYGQTYVKVWLLDGSERVGELVKEHDAGIEFVDLRDGKKKDIPKRHIKRVRKNLKDTAVITDLGIGKFVAWNINKRYPQSTLAGKVALVKDEVFYINRGEESNIRTGFKLTVFRSGEAIRDPDTGNVLGTDRKIIAELEVIETQPKFCKAKLVGKATETPKKDDEVTVSKSGRIVAILPMVNVEGNETIGGKKLAEVLSVGLVKNKIQVVERSRLSAVLKELELQSTKSFDETKSQKIGKQIGARGVFTGTVSPVSKTKNIARIRYVHVATGEIGFAFEYEFQGSMAELDNPKPWQGNRKNSTPKGPSLKLNGIVNVRWANGGHTKFECKGGAVYYYTDKGRFQCVSEVLDDGSLALSLPNKGHFYTVFVQQGNRVVAYTWKSKKDYQAKKPFTKGVVR